MKNSRFVLTLIVGSCFAMPAHAFVQTDLDCLLKTNACPKCDLSGAMLAGMDLGKAKLEGANLAGADLAKTSLRMADLAGANLSGSILQGTIFEAADLFKANLSGAQLDGAIFEGAYLAEATIDESQREKLAGGNSSPQGSPPKPEERSGEKADLEAGQGKDTALEPAGQAALSPSLAEPTAAESVPATTQPLAAEQNNPLSGNLPLAMPTIASPPPPTPVATAIKQEALLKQAKQSGVCVDCDFSGMTLGNVSLKGLSLERVNFAAAQMTGANFTKTILKAAKFRGANLQGATFRGADLYLADFSGANLEGTDFRGAALDGAILTDAILTGAQFDAGPK